jgi:hypothetical protein
MFSNFKGYLGCQYQGEPTYGAIFDDPNMTIEKCMDACAKANYSYSFLEPVLRQLGK